MASRAAEPVRAAGGEAGVLASRSAATEAPAGAEASLPLPARMGRFVLERFPLATNGVAVLLFFVTNAAVAQAATSAAPVAFGPRSALAALGLGLMFLRLRLFDEVKDAAHDRAHNPGRPIPRGLVSEREVNLWAAATAALEGAIAAALGRGALSGFALVLGFTLLMRFEFFARAVLRPRLFTYALLHTPSGGLIGLFVFCAVTGRPFWEAPRAMWLYVGAGWALLMVFEVARKTFDPETEPGPDTYSSVFGPRGAAALNAACVAAASALVALSVLDALGTVGTRAFLGLTGGLTALVLALVLRYALAPARATAAQLRAAGQAYLLLASIFAAGQILLARGLAFRSGA